MNKKETLNLEKTSLLHNKGQFKILKTFLAALMLFGVFISGCKKDGYTGEVIGLCPKVTTDPMDKAVDVVLDKVVTLTFNTVMSASTINKNTFTITQNGTLIDGTISPTTNAAVFTFKPTVPLNPFLTYTGTVTTGARDTLRTALTENYVWTFTSIPQISVSANPSTSGTVSGAGNFAQGSTITVTATPKAGFVFTNFTNNGVVVSTSSSYQFKVNGNVALVANFAPVQPGNSAVILSSNPVNGGTTTGSGSYPTTSVVTVTAKANSGYTFMNWTDNGVIASTSANYTFTLAGNRTLVANFMLIPSSQVSLTLSSNPVAGGMTDGEGSYNIGSSVTAIATPNSDYTFVNWTDNGVIASTSANYTFVLNTNRSLVANFAIKTFTINVTANNGKVVKNPNQPNYPIGSSVQLTATADPGYQFIGWSGDASGSANPLTVVMNGNKNITANFELISSNFILTVNATNGTVAKNPNQPTYASGTSVQLTATPNTGFQFTGWSGDASGSANPLTVLMNGNKNITANFAPIVVPSSILGSAAMFGAFGGNAGVTNEGINTVINNGGISTTAASTLITGFHDALTGDVYTETGSNKGNVTQGIFTAPPAPGNATKFAIAVKALADANTAYNSISPASRPGGTDPGAGELGGLTLAPGTYMSASGTFKITNGNLTLDAKGDPNAQWFFQTAAGLTVGIAGPAGARSVNLIGGAQSKNVFWYVGSAAVINGAGGGVMVGTIISRAGVTFSTSGNAVQTVLNGRAISLIFK